MDRKFLENMGIEKDDIDKILDKYHESNKASQEQIKTLEAEKKTLENQISERDKDLEELKKVDVNELNNKISELETKNRELKETSDKELLEAKKSFAIDSALKDAKARNIKSIRGLLDMDKITYKEGKLEGLDEQINSYKKSDSYLFDIQDPTKTVDLGGEHKPTNTPDLSKMSFDEYKEYRKNN